jgi:ribokinase
VTAGARRALAVTADGAFLRAAYPKILPVDTTGAGDTFVGAFASMLDEQAPLQKALKVGCEAAALKCLQAGAQPGMPIGDRLKSIGWQPPLFDASRIYHQLHASLALGEAGPDDFLALAP